MLIDHEKLRAVSRAILEAGGSAAGEAKIVADHLVEAHLKGHPSHGTGMIARYFEALHQGGLRPNQPIEVVKDDGPFLVIDGGQGYGHRAAREAMERAIAKTKEVGLVLLALRNCCHIGRIGTYGEMAVDAGLISLHFVNVTGRSPIVAPFGGSDARMLTNPMVVAVPASDDRPAFVLDMATSRIAMGKVRVAMMQERELGEGYIIGPDGQPATDPSIMYAEDHGALLPVGDHKGYGLAMACELLAGMLTGGGTIQPGNPRSGTPINNMFAIVVDPSRLVDDDYMRAEVDAMIDYAKASPAADPAAPVLVAGEPEAMRRRAMTTSGIEIEENTWEALMAAGESVGLSRQKIAEIIDEGG